MKLQDSKNLLLVVADKDAEFGLSALLNERYTSLGIRKVSFYCVRDPKRDPGVRTDPLRFLRGRLNDSEKAMLVFDLEGSGAKENKPVKKLEEEMERLLSVNGWDGRCSVVILEPELESWIWDRACSLTRVINFQPELKQVRSMLVERGFLGQSQIKPDRPKEGFELLLREAGTRRSSSLYADIAKTVNMEGCADRAFRKFKATLQDWFPVSS